MTTYVAVARMSHGRWVASCPRPGCVNAEAFGRCDDGTIGGLEGDRFTCRTEGHTQDGRRAAYGGCGLRCGVEWPGNVTALERVLFARPAPSSRNWTPGETVEDLVRENLMHGLVPSDVLNGGPTRPVLEFVGGDPVAGALEFDPDPTMET